MTITSLTLNNKYQFNSVKGCCFTLIVDDHLKALLCSDGYVWCLEPKIHRLKDLEAAINYFVQALPKTERKNLNSCSFMKAVFDQGSDFESKCLQHNERVPYV